jgi:hypothetical protein
MISGIVVIAYEAVIKAGNPQKSSQKVLELHEDSDRERTTSIYLEIHDVCFS